MFVIHTCKLYTTTTLRIDKDEIRIYKKNVHNKIICRQANRKTVQNKLFTTQQTHLQTDQEEDGRKSTETAAKENYFYLRLQRAKGMLLNLLLTAVQEWRG